ncbi:MAG: hypothetical protein IPN38_11530 [Flavobacteriales bacterium]|nr:hypothetical protein [Flavobacteriales bacterium]
MLRLLHSRTLLLLVLLLASAQGWGQVNMTTTGSHSQTFDGLANTGSTNTWADNSTIANWYAQRTGNGTTYTASTGSSNSGALYSFGSNLSQ